MIKKIAVFLVCMFGVSAANAATSCGSANASADDWTYAVTSAFSETQCYSCPIVLNSTDVADTYGAQDANNWYVNFTANSYKVYGTSASGGASTCSCAVTKIVHVETVETEGEEDEIIEETIETPWFELDVGNIEPKNVFTVTKKESSCPSSCAKDFKNNSNAERTKAGYWYVNPTKNYKVRSSVTDCSFSLSETETGGTKHYKVLAESGTVWKDKALVGLSPDSNYCIDGTSFVAKGSVPSGTYCDSTNNNVIKSCPDGTCCLSGVKYNCNDGTYSAAGKQCLDNTAGLCDSARNGYYFDNGTEKRCPKGTCCLGGNKYDCNTGTYSTAGKQCLNNTAGLCDAVPDGQYITEGGSFVDCEMGYCCINGGRYECTNGTFTVSTKTSCTGGVEGACLKFSGDWTWPTSGLNLGPINLSNN